ncbi:MAG TPA: hypothetical protein DHV24_13600 [Candidatus Margulisbacteria bacterium]|nr:hypothetical protein [Candidatus Margulisiibacteriota bacterium]
MKQNNERYDKNMFSERKDGTPVKYISFQNKNDQYIHLVSKLKDNKDFSSIAVLYRNNVSAIPVADALSASAIPFYLREAKTHFFRHWVTMDIISFFDLSNDAANTGAFRQIYYKMNAFLSKVMFEYSVKNRMPNKTLFDTLLEYPDLTEKQYDKILAIKKNFQKMSKLNAHEAIEFIVNALGYGEYINKQSSDATDSTDGLNQIISSLKSIAARTDSVQSFKDRLERLQQIMQNAKFNKGKNAVTLSTVHSSKGLEFDCVYMIDLFDGQFPSVNSIREAKSGNRSLMEEEVRLFYVGATRARHQLELMASNTLDGNRVKPSRFIELFLDIPKKKQTVIADSSKWEIELDDYVDQGPISAKNLYLEMPVAHKMFGLGNIRSINWKTDILEIFFVDIGIKIFSLSTCINADLLHTLGNKNLANSEPFPGCIR